jgi:hypothetical protein
MDTLLDDENKKKKNEKRTKKKLYESKKRVSTIKNTVATYDYNVD